MRCIVHSEDGEDLMAKKGFYFLLTYLFKTRLLDLGDPWTWRRKKKKHSNFFPLIMNMGNQPQQ